MFYIEIAIGVLLNLLQMGYECQSYHVIQCRVIRKNRHFGSWIQNESRLVEMSFKHVLMPE